MAFSLFSIYDKISSKELQISTEQILRNMRHRHRQTDRRTDKQTERQVNRQTDRQTDRETVRWTDGQD